MTPLEIVRQTSPIVNQPAGNRFYFDADTMARGKELGLDGFRFYFLGRGGVLGDVEPAVVVASFGYFSPGVVELMWDSAKQVLPRGTPPASYLACADRFGVAKLDGIDVLDAFNGAAEAAIASVDRSALLAVRRDRAPSPSPITLRPTPTGTCASCASCAAASICSPSSRRGVTVGRPRDPAAR